MFYRILNKFFPAKQSKIFPRLLASTPVDENIKPLNEYRAFIAGLTTTPNCLALLSAAEGDTANVNVDIKDWFYTAQHFNNEFVLKVIIERYREIEAKEQSTPLVIKDML